VASVAKRIRNSRTTWLARWRDLDGRSRKRSFKRRIDADRFVTKVAADPLRGDYVDPNDPTTVQEYAEAWRLAQVHRPTTPSARRDEPSPSRQPAFRQPQARLDPPE
jgi:hypothetical protein